MIYCQTGSKSVITLNLNRIIQDYVRLDYQSDTLPVPVKDFLDNSSFKEYISDVLERVYKYHTAYNELLWDMYNSGLLPVYKAGFIDLNKQYLTIGINGLNEAAEFLGISLNDNELYARFCQDTFSTIKQQNELHKTKKTTFNTECVPAESLAIKNYNWDKKDGYVVPEDRNLYASYIYLPSDPTTSVLEKIRMHGKNYIGDYLDGGSAAHINLDSHLSVEQYKHIIKYAADEGCSYLTFNIPMSICDECGHIVNRPIDECPKCHSKRISFATRIIGYLTLVKNWSSGRKKEFESRVFHGKTPDEDKKFKA